MPDLARFKTAQEQPAVGFAAALSELQAGGKRNHWIWYIFPQLAGLGRSPASEFFGLSDVAEAQRYLEDDLLRERLTAVTSVVVEQQRAGVSLVVLMGGSIDALKLVSCMTLFGAIAQHLSSATTGDVFRPLSSLAHEVLTRAAREGYTPCAYSLERLAAKLPASGDHS